MMLFFRFSAVKEGSEDRGSFFFLVDNVKIAFVDEFTANGQNPQGSATIILELTAGQEVQIMNYQSTTVWGTSDNHGFIWSWFTGFLLHAD